MATNDQTGPAVTLAQSVWRDVTVQNAVAVQNAIIAHPDTVHQIVNSGDALIARSRSLLATKFLDEIPESDVLVFVDGDITFSPDDFAKIVEGARESGDIYGGLYVTRAREPHLASLPLKEQAWSFQATPERRPLEVRYLATGFMAIPRAVLEEMYNNRGPGFDDLDGTHRLHRYERGTNGDAPIDFFRTFGIREDDGSNHWLSEDWAFCERWRQLGGKVWGDQSIVLGHQGAITLTVEDLPETATKPAESSGVERHTFSKQPQHPRIAELPADIAAFTEEDEAMVRRMLPQGTGYVAALWEQREESISEWYLREDVGHAYLLDLAHWHMNGAADSFFEDIDRVSRNGRALDFGSGIGTLAHMLADTGDYRVAGYEPNRVLEGFAASRAPGGQVQFTTEIDDLNDQRFDLIIATHVFEHLASDDEVRATVELFSTLLADDGCLFIENDWHADAGHPQHQDLSVAFEDAMRLFGFTHTGGRWWAG